MADTISVNCNQVLSLNLTNSEPFEIIECIVLVEEDDAGTVVSTVEKSSYENGQLTEVVLTETRGVGRC